MAGCGSGGARRGKWQHLNRAGPAGGDDGVIPGRSTAHVGGRTRTDCRYEEGGRPAGTARAGAWRDADSGASWGAGGLGRRGA
jgi:hypothetical protein